MDTKELRERHDAALKRMEDAGAAIAAAPEDSTEEALDALAAEFDTAEGEYTRAKANLGRAERTAEARKNAPVEAPVAPKDEERKHPAGSLTVKEPLTYQRNGERSFMRDLVNANSRRDPDASERIIRHGREMQVEYRDMSTADTTSVGDVVVPKWLVDELAPIRRARRAFADTWRNMGAPTTDVYNIPRVTTGGSVHFQTAENTTMAEQDMVTGTVSAVVKTVGGFGDVSIQTIDLAAINVVDSLVLPDLLSLHASLVETSVVQGTGANGQISGLLTTSGTNTVAYASAAPTAGTIVQRMVSAGTLVEAGYFAPPDLYVMHPRRWGSLMQALDGNGRPLVVPVAQAPQNSLAQFGGQIAEGVCGFIQGIPVVKSNGIPTNDGAGTTNDVILAVVRENLLMWEGPIRSKVLTEVLSHAGTVRIQIYSYLAATAGKYPLSISAIRGTGLATP
jgi:HK97 family phage major capsid protein